MRSCYVVQAAVLSIDTIEAGSPTVNLTLSITDHTGRLTDLLSTDAATVLDEIHGVVIGPRGLLQLTRQIRNRAITASDPADEAGFTRVTLENDETLEARAQAVELYLDRGARRNANAVVRPLRHPDLETLELVSPTAAPTLITELDADAFDLPTATDPEWVVTEAEMLVDVAAPAFPVNNKWRLSNGTAGSFWATIGDGAFLNRVNAGEPFRKGDSLLCLFKLTRRETTLGHRPSITSSRSASTSPAASSSVSTRLRRPESCCRTAKRRSGDSKCRTVRCPGRLGDGR